MLAISESTRGSLIVRLLDHAETNWPQLTKVQARYRGSLGGALTDERAPSLRHHRTDRCEMSHSCCSNAMPPS